MKRREKAIAECVDQFVRNVLDYSAYIFKDPTTANQYYESYIKALRKLTKFGSDGLSALSILLENDEPVVRITAASYLVHFATTKALEVLRAAKNEDRAIAMLAIVTLKRWEMGTYLDPATGWETKRKTAAGSVLES